MTVARDRAVGLVLKPDFPWISGGLTESNDEPLATSEYFNETLESWVQTIELQENKFGHCGTVLDDGAIAVISGGNPTYRSVETCSPVENMENMTSMFGAALNYDRWFHGCSYFKNIDGENIPMVAGKRVSQGQKRMSKMVHGVGFFQEGFRADRCPSKRSRSGTPPARCGKSLGTFSQSAAPAEA